MEDLFELFEDGYWPRVGDPEYIFTEYERWLESKEED